MFSLSSWSLSSLDTPCNSRLVIVYFVLNVKSTDQYQFLFNACWRCVCFKDTFYFQGVKSLWILEGLPTSQWSLKVCVKSYCPGRVSSRPGLSSGGLQIERFLGVLVPHPSSRGCIPSFHFLVGKCHFFCVFDGCSRLACGVCSLTEWLFCLHLVWNAETRDSWIYLSTGAFLLSSIHICHFVFHALVDWQSPILALAFSCDLTFPSRKTQKTVSIITHVRWWQFRVQMTAACHHSWEVILLLLSLGIRLQGDRAAW